jgi:carbon-monoxide dehydrogenase large subunit
LTRGELGIRERTVVVNSELHRHVGRSVPRVEDPPLLRGEASFVDDIHLPAMLHAHFLRSPIAHGLIRNIGLDKAREMPGVRALFTYADLRARHTTDRIPVAVPGRGIRSMSIHQFSLNGK